MSAASASTGLASYLQADPAVSALTAGHVFRPQLDTAVMTSMPQACVVVRSAGGYRLFGGAQVPLGDPRLDIFCYGSTWLEAESVAEAVLAALRALKPSTYGSTRLYWARIEMGPTPYEDPETNWPALVVSAQLALSEIAAA